jgi:hypothetical protein
MDKSVLRRDLPRIHELLNKRVITRNLGHSAITNAVRSRIADRRDCELRTSHKHSDHCSAHAAHVRSLPLCYQYLLRTIDCSAQQFLHIAWLRSLKVFPYYVSGDLCSSLSARLSAHAIEDEVAKTSWGRKREKSIFIIFALATWISCSSVAWRLLGTLGVLLGHLVLTWCLLRNHALRLSSTR